MENIPMPKPPSNDISVTPIDTGVNFKIKFFKGNAYWAMVVLDASGNTLDSLSGTYGTWNHAKAKSLARVVYQFARDTNMSIRSRNYYSFATGENFGYNLKASEILTTSLAMETKLNNAIRYRINEHLKSVIIYTDASWGTPFNRVGVGWVCLLGNNARIEGKFFGKQHPRYAERFAIFQGLKSIYNEVYNAVGSDAKIIIRTDMKYTAEWAENLFKGARTLSYTDLPNTELHIFVSKCLVNKRNGSGPEIVFEWVRGHNGDVWNEYADRAAVLTRRSGDVKIDNKRAMLNLKEEVRQTVQELFGSNKSSR